MYKILVSDALAEEGLRILTKEKEFQVDVDTKLTPQQLKEKIKDYDALIVRSGTKATKEIIDAGTRLKVIGRAGVGLDNVDADSASLRGIIVMNTPAGNTVSTTEHAMSLLLSLARSIPQANASLRQKKWDRKSFMGIELYGKTLGIIGLGRIGGEVAKRAESFGMHAIAYDPFLSQDKAKQLEVTPVTFKELLKRSDFLTIHTPLTDETKHMISDREFDMMKKGVRIINCARGGIIDERALEKAIKSGKVAGAALDVFEEEPPLNSPLIDMPNVVSTPHLGASTEEAQVNVSVEIAQQVADALLGRGIRNAVNMPSVDPEAYKILEPYINLAEKLGGLQGQLADGPILGVDIRYQGEITKHDLSSLTVAILKGMLTPFLQETVNYVNAQFIAKERGIKVNETKTADVENYANAITVEVATKRSKSEVMGTLFTRDDPRIVKLWDFHVDAVPSGYMLVISNIDKPGIVGQIGTILGSNNINIAGMNFGREKAGGRAVTVLNIDSPVPEAVLNEIKSAKNITDAKVIKL